MTDYVVTENASGGWHVQSVDLDHPTDHQPTRSDAVAAARRKIRTTHGGTLTVKDVHGSVVQTDRVDVPKNNEGNISDD